MAKPKNGLVVTKDFSANYIKFGNGKKILIMIPGVGDGLKTVKGLAIPFSILYKKFSKDYTIYSFSRRNKIPKGFSIKNMTDDLVKCMDKLDIKNADILGVSQGGMIGQTLAINYPDRVNKLILVVTTPKTTDLLKEVVDNWIGLAYKNDYKSIMIDTAIRSYTGKYIEKSKKIYSLLSNISKPKSFDRFIVMCKSCLIFDVYRELNKIKSPTFIIGGSDDNVLGVEGSILLNKKIKNSELYIYEGYSHGLYEQAKDFNDKVLEFLKK
ncbi:MAG: alpha/beta hydrolase [Bacilli bacterium]|nr:alpha/beta hydrolase [Bacilli bacterium]